MVRLSSWRRGIFFRATAGLLVGSLGVGSQAFAFGPTPASIPTTPASGARPAAPPAEMVPGRLRVARVTFPGGGVPWALDPRVLLDGDARTSLPSAGDTPVELRFQLAGAQQIDGLRIWGAPGGMVSARAELDGQSAPIAGLVDRRITGSADRWNRLDASGPVRADAVVLEWRSAPAGAHLDEIELWGAVPLSPNLPDASLADQLVGGVPPGAATISAEPRETIVVGDKVSTLDWEGTASFELDRDPTQLGRTFLVYELEGLERLSESIRSINGLPSRGGAMPVLKQVAGVQVEEISPRWLRSGRNEIHFLPVVASYLTGYKVRNLRLVTVSDDGRATPTVESVSRDLAATDGMIETAVRARPARGASDASGLDLEFGRRTQPQELAFHLPAAFAGTLFASTAQGKSSGKTSVDLSELSPGWHRIPLDHALPPSDSVHVAVRAAGEAVGSISEIRVTGSPLPVGRPQALTLVYPLHGECVDHNAYVRGFTTRDSQGATLKVNGRPRPDALGPDGSFEIIVPEAGNASAPGKPWTIDLALSTPDGARAARQVRIEGCFDQTGGTAVAGNTSIPTDGPREDRGAPYRVLVKAGEAKTLSFGGATLDIPAGAVDKDTQVTIRPLLEAQLAPVEQVMSNVMPERKGYRFGPHGMTFKKPVRVSLPYERDLLPPGMEDGDVFAFYYDEGDARWRTIARLETPRRGKVESATTHFTDFITSTLAVPDHPTAQSFNPNSMKDVKLGDPAAGIDLITAPEASSDGAAHLSYPIKLPPGRHGMHPSLALSYSSETANGWLGVGWTLPVSAIEIDTRFGVPNYDGKDVYLLDGQPLTTTDGQFYSRRAEGRFDRIERFGSSAATHYFIVTDKAGTQFVYGQSDCSSQSDCGRLAMPDGAKNTFRWYLERVQDTFGNTVTYHYRHMSGVTPGPGTGLPWVQTYLSTIDYTGHVGTPALEPRYHVVFTSKDNRRRDIMSSARSKFDVRTRERLEQIDVLFDQQIIRSYRLGYNDDASVPVSSSLGKTLLTSVSMAGLGGFDANKPDQGRLAQHTFDYVAMDVGSDGVVAGFATPAQWASLGDTGLSEGEDGEGGFNAFAGVGPGTCYPHAGGGASVSVGGDSSNRQFIDINGDGLPDLVSDDGSAQLNGFASQDRSAGSFSTRSYGFAGPLASSSRVNLGVQLGAHGFGELGSATAFFSWNFSSEHSALVDFNGDGWPDLVSNDGSNVLLNKDGSFSALPQSAPLTPAASGKQLSDDLPDDATRQAFNRELHKTSPLIRWVAPFAGHVIVSGGAQLVAVPAGSDPGDGVIATVNKTDDEGFPPRPVTRELWRHQINPGDSACGPASFNACGSGLVVHVLKGDRLYFRLDPGGSITGDTTAWSPTVTFRDLCPTPTTLPRLCPPLTDTQLQAVDAFDLPLYRYTLDPSDNNGDGKQDGDFRLPDTLASGFTAAADGTVTITADVGRQKAGNPFTVRVLRNQVTVASQTIDGAVGTTPITWNVDVLSGDQLLFAGDFSAHDVDTLWIDWRPRVAYSLICGPDAVTLQSTCRHVGTCALLGGARLCDLEQFPGETEPQRLPEDTIVAFSEIRDDASTGASASNFTTFDVQTSGQLELGGTLSKLSTQSSIQLQIQSTRQRLFSREVGTAAIPDTSPISIPDLTTEPPVVFNVVAGDKLTFFVKVGTPADLFDFQPGQPPEPRVAWKPTLGYLGSGSSDPATVNQVFDAAAAQNTRLSGGFRGWSYAEWNSSATFDETLLDPQDKNNVPFNPLSAHTPSLARKLPDRVQQVPGPLWLGRGVDFYLAPGSMKPSSIGGIDTQQVGNAPGLRRSRGNSTELGVSLIGSVSQTQGGSTGELDFMDLNGDRRPDSISDNQVQFSSDAGFGPATDLGMTVGDSRQIDTANSRFGIAFGSGASALADKLGASGAVKTAVSLLPSLGQNYGVSSTKVEFVDVNGDGLPDHVRATSPTQFTVQLNLGGTFGPETYLEIGASAPIDAFSGSTLGGALQAGLPALDTTAVRAEDNTTNNLQIGYAGIGGGIAYSVNRTLTDFIDVNGDSLPDRVAKQPGENFLRVKLNLGDHFDEETKWTLPAWDVQIEKDITKAINGGNDALAFSETGTINVGIGAAIGISLFFGCLMLEIGVTIGVGNNSAELTFEDVDGDGKADQVLKLSKGVFRPNRQDLRAKLNQIGKTNLLRRVTRPLGGSFDIAYKREGNAVRRDMTPMVDMPHSQWVMASVSVSDGMQTPPYVRTFDYAADGQSPTATVKIGSGFYDRDEREEYGYAHVTETREDRSVVEHFFHTEDFYRKGLEQRRVEKDRDGMLFTIEEMTYDDPTGLGLPARTGTFFPAMLSRALSTYEGTTTDASQAITTRIETMTYTGRGDIRTMTLSDPAGGTKVAYAVGYREIPGLFVVKADEVKASAGGALLRQRNTTYSPLTGAMETLTDSVFGGKDPVTGAVRGATPATSAIAYDSFGNMQSFTDPNGVKITYQFDDQVHAFNVSATDAFGLTSTSTPNFLFGAMDDMTDVNGQKESFKYDNFGRLVQIFGPKDPATGDPTIEFVYGTQAGAAPVPAWAQTRHKDIRRAGDPIETVTFIDGLSRVLQTKKDIEKDLGSGTSTAVGMTVSGRVQFDERGRLSARGQPIFSTAPATQFLAFDIGPNVTHFSSDILGRPTSVVTPDGATTRTFYASATLDGRSFLATTVVDPNLKMRINYRDAYERITAVHERNTIGGAMKDLITRYAYDPLDQLTTIRDPKENVTSVTYDSVGHTVALVSPDAGRTEYRYDLGGNMAVKETANLRANGQLIRYRYDRDRLLRIDYPSSDPVLYTYGELGAPFGRAGRIVTQTDESGVEELSYGELGEVVKTVKTFASQPHTLDYQATTLFTYDSFGRMLDLTYPDGEKVTYGYDAGGSIKTLAGTKAGTNYVYVSHLGYDEFESRARLIQGNGVETRYTYDPQTRRLSDVAADLPGAKPLQRLHFGYDLVGNVLTLANNIAVPPSNEMGGPTSFRFGYDDLYQLVHATGDYRFPPNKDRKFTFDTSFDEIGNVRRKTQADAVFQPSGSSVPQKPTSYDVAYEYAGPRPHATSHIGTQTYSYDPDGNQTGWTDDNTGQRRGLTWNEEDRLSSLSDDGHNSSYLYDAQGTRTHKRVENGLTIYVNQFYSIKNGQVATKHFFAGDTRIASKPEQSSGTGKPTEQAIYFFNPDQLGSSNYVTDQRARIFQHDEFFPSGETWIEESSTLERTPYLFSGKELDETRLYYFGARYYDPRTSVWQNTDPALSSFVGRGPGGISPKNLGLYTYAWNNPMVVRDPDGRWARITVTGHKVEVVIPTYFQDNSTKSKNEVDAQIVKWKAEIEQTWSGKFGEYEVTAKVQQLTREQMLAEKEGVNVVTVLNPRASKGEERGSASIWEIGPKEPKFSNAKHEGQAILTMGAGDGTAPHEFGHLLGFGNDEFKLHTIMDPFNIMTTEKNERTETARPYTPQILRLLKDPPPPQTVRPMLPKPKK